MNQDHAILKEFIIKEESVRTGSHFMYTQLRILHRPTEDSRIIHHFKYFDWTETDAPDVELILDFLLKVNKQDQYYFKRTIVTNQRPAKPIVVADICLYQMIHRLKVSVPLMVLKARQQRRFSIPTLNHYIFIHNFILNFLSIIKVKPEVYFDFRLHLSHNDTQLFMLL
ncbi:hypothetical protein G9C98_001398 [Cotesia typhae]|uniref:Tyrosine-protein phosphatase domain-containing protein n=1 Tax=Cotesia typhae TaxID=2053667 RepID=A0A8J5QU64_9HYME|nr:hypothetical protein G9C98_001398 [Cotesia typhae]